MGRPVVKSFLRFGRQQADGTRPQSLSASVLRELLPQELIRLKLHIQSHAPYRLKHFRIAESVLHDAVVDHWTKTHETMRVVVLAVYNESTDICSQLSYMVLLKSVPEMILMAL